MKLDKSMDVTHFLGEFHKYGYYFTMSKVAQQVRYHPYTEAVRQARQLGIPNFNAWCQMKVREETSKLKKEHQNIMERVCD